MGKQPILKGSEILAQSLIREGAEAMFGIPGGVVLPFYDSLVHRAKEMRHILPRQEQGGGFAADGYARVSGKPAIALGTSGPGATNLLTCMANSMLDSIPVIYITGQVMEELIGTDAFQETDIIGMSISIVKHSYLVTKAEDISRVVKEAFYLAKTGRPGPVHIDFIKDVWGKKVPYIDNPIMDLPGYDISINKFSDLDILSLNHLFEKDGLRPVIIAGHGVELSQAEQALIRFAEKHHFPVVNTLLGLGTFPQNHSLWCGMLGMHGDAVANYVVDKSNLIIGVGCRFDDRITGNLKAFTKGKTFIHIDIDPSEIHKNIAIHVPLVGNALDILDRANELLDDHDYPVWREEIGFLKEKYGFLDFTFCSKPKQGCLSQARLIDLLSKETGGNSIICSDVGRHQMWVARFYRFNQTRSHISSGGLGTMGYGLPAAIGAKIACPDREVWAVCGDGGFKMNIQELCTLAENHLDVNVAIMEDKAYGMVYQWQNLLFEQNIAYSRFTNPDFIKLADAFGIPAWKAFTMKEAQQAVQQSRKTKGPSLVVFEVDPSENVFPMVYPNTPLGEQKLQEDHL